MSGFATATIFGRLTADPTVTTSTGGMSLAKFTLAVNRKRRDTEEVSYFDCVAFGKTADTVGEYLSKGSAPIVEGELVQESWTDKATGAKRSKIVLNVNRVHFTGSKSENAPTAQPRPAARPVAPIGMDDNADDVPF